MTDKNNIRQDARIEEILNPSLRVRIRDFFTIGMRWFFWDSLFYGHPINDELIVATLQEEMRMAEKHHLDSVAGKDLSATEQRLCLLEAQIAACDRVIDEAVSLRKREALRHCLQEKACFELERDALQTERL